MADIDDELKQLYERFKEDMREHPGEAYYEEDDLVMVYDLAGDYRDRYTQLNVLILGRRLFPDSEALELRLGIALTEMYDGTASLSEFLERNAHRRGVMWEILRVRGSNELSINIPPLLDEIVDKYTFEEDENIIQFVNLVADTMCEEWLAYNYKRFADKCRYRDTALGECAEVLCQGFHAQAIEAIEELTRIDPFNVEAWMRLAELHHEANNADEGLAAIEYAIALDPENLKAWYIEARLLLLQDEKSSKAAELLRRILDREPGMFMARASLSDLLEVQGENDKAYELWQEAMEIQPDDDLVKGCIERFRRKLDGGEDNKEFEDVDDLILANIHNEDELAEAVGQMLGVGDEEIPAALKLLETYDKTYGIYQFAGEYIKLLYRYGRLFDITRFMERERPDGAGELRFDPASIPVYAASLLRLGRYLDAEVTAREYLLKAGSVCTTPELSMAFAGVKIALNYILDRAAERNYTYGRDPIAEALR